MKHETTNVINVRDRGTGVQWKLINEVLTWLRPWGPVEGLSTLGKCF